LTIKDLLKLLLGVLLLVYIIYSVGISDILNALLKVRLHFLLLAIFFYFLLDLGLSYRVYLCLRWLGHDIPWKEVFWSHLFGMFLSNFTPGRAGYIGITYNLRNKAKIPISESMSVIGIVQSIDFVVKGFAALLGLSFVLVVVGGGKIVTLGLLGIGVVFFLSISFLVLMWKDVPFAIKLVKKLPLVGEMMGGFLEDMKGPSRRLKNKAPIFAGFSFLFWLMRGLEWTSIGYACNIPLPFIVFWLLHPLLTSIRYVPLTPAGIGMFEGITLIGFSLFGVPLENAFLLSLFDRLDNILVDFLAIKEFRYL